MATENRKARDIVPGDQQTVVVSVVEKRQRDDTVTLIWSNGQTSTHQPDDALAIEVDGLEPDPEPAPQSDSADGDG